MTTDLPYVTVSTHFPFLECYASGIIHYMVSENPAFLFSHDYFEVYFIVLRLNFHRTQYYIIKR